MYFWEKPSGRFGHKLISDTRVSRVILIVFIIFIVSAGVHILIVVIEVLRSQLSAVTLPALLSKK